MTPVVPLRYYSAMYKEDISKLPITEVIEPLRASLLDSDDVILQAPPGAGKTTIVPLELMDEHWLQGLKILVLEPRRVAARAAASRMAELLGEVTGQTVGYRIRLDSQVSTQTRIEVITEGILTRMLQSDPGLEDVGLIIFDEFHERNLDSDLCLALAYQGRTLFREGPPLKLLVMSATLDGERIAEILDGAPIVTSQGRQFPVTTEFGDSYQLRDSIVPPTVNTVLRALDEQTGSILVFLPGQAEISRVAKELNEQIPAEAKDLVQIESLYGGLPLAEQRQAIEPAPDGVRKIVLSTNLAETSLTIEGIEVVVDAGLVREAVFDPATGMTRLTTRRVSRSSADQREGRAGRLGPGFCYRLWSEEQHDRLVQYPTAEILQADLAPMALQLLSWGVEDTQSLVWLDPPPEAPYSQAVSILEQCGAIFKNEAGIHHLTPHGVRLAQMPLHPRLAHMLLVGCDIHATETACLLAAILSERNPLANRGVDILSTIGVLMGQERCPPQFQSWFKRIWEQARRYARLASGIHKPRKYAITVPQEDMLGVLLASAYPDRVARRRSDDNRTDFHLSNGRSAQLPEADGLAGQQWLAVAEIGGVVGEASDRIYSATTLNPECFGEVLSTLVNEQEHVEWDYRAERFVAERHNRVGSILLSTEPLHVVSDAARGAALLGVVRKKGLSILPWNSNLQQWRSRIELLYGAYAQDKENPWPDLSDEALLDSLEEWLLPYLSDIKSLQDFQQLDLKAILRSLLPWPLPLELERLAPERWAAPSGSSIAIDYSESPPVLPIKLQEMFGCETTPAVAQGRIPLLVHLLSPAQRPLHVTQDLASFWRNGYEEVKKEMRGRYPKHPWPDDPLTAAPTGKTKRHAS